MLAGEKEKMPVEFCGDAVNIVCCEPPAVDRTESNKSLVTDYFFVSLVKLATRHF